MAYDILTAKEAFLLLSIRQKTMLQSILGHPEGISGRQLSELLRVSGKTIRNDVAAVNRWLKAFDCCVSASQKSGYFIREEDKNKINDILENLNQPEQSREAQTPQERRFAVLDRVLGRPGTSIYLLADRLCVSEQTIYKDIAYLERVLEKDYDFKELTVQNGRIFMKAPECEIRRLVFCMLTDRIWKSGQLMDNCLYNLMQGIVNLNEIHTFYQYVERYCRESGIITSDQLLYICAWTVFYTNVRREEAFFLENREAVSRSDKLADFLKAMNRDFFLELEECDLEVIYQFLQAAGFPEGSSEISKEGQELFLEFQKKLSCQYGISLIADRQIQESFCRNLDDLLHRIRLRTQLSPRAYGGKRERSLMISQAARLLGRLIYERYGAELKTGELYWIEEYLMACDDGRPQAIRALIVFGADEGWYYQVRRWIREQFQREIILCGACPQYMLEELCREGQPELLIATQPMDIRAGIPKITLSGSLSEAEKRRLKGFLEDMTAKKRMIQARKFLDTGVHVRFLAGSASWEEAAAECGHVLADHGCFGEKQGKAGGAVLPGSPKRDGQAADGCWFFIPAERDAALDGISICIFSDPEGQIRIAAASALTPQAGDGIDWDYSFGAECVCEGLWKLLQTPEQAEMLLKSVDSEQVIESIWKNLEHG